MVTATQSNDVLWLITATSASRGYMVWIQSRRAGWEQAFQSNQTDPVSFENNVIQYVPISETLWLGF